MTLAATSQHRPPSESDGDLPDARETVLRSFGKPGRGYWLLLAVLTAIVAVGVAAWVIQLRDGMGVAGYNDHAFWAVYIADVVTFIGVSYGGAVISAILRLTGADWRAPLSRLAEGTAVVTVLIGGAFIVPHLGRPDRIYELITRPNLSSPIFWDFVAIGTYTIASIVFFALPLVPDMAILHRFHPDRLGHRDRLYARISRGWIGSPRQKGVLRGALGLISIMIIPLAVSVHSVLSWAFALVSRPWWHESIWAPYFVVAALYSGVALVILVVAGFRRAYHLEQLITERHFIRLGFIMATFAAAYLYLTFADILPDAYVGENGTSTVFRELLAGHFAPWFWTFVVGAGVLPLLIVAIPRTRTVTGIVIAAAAIVPAMWLKRMLMVADPATYDRVTNLFGTYHFTWVPISITLGGAAAIPLLLMLLFRAVPLLAIDEIEELQIEELEGEIEGAPETVRQAVIEPTRAATANPERPQVVETTAEPPPPPSADNRRRSRRWLLRWGAAGGLIALGATIWLTQAAPARADAPAKPAPAVVALNGTQASAGVLLTARLTDAKGMPIAKASVQFFQRITEFGPKGQLVPLGTAVTNQSGIASVTDHPTVTGRQQFVASFAGGAMAGQATGTVKVTVTTARPVYHPAAAKPFATIGKGLVGVLLITVTLVLITLAVQLERVRRVCRAGG